MRSATFAASLLLLGVTPFSAQSNQTLVLDPTFDVVSIKRNTGSGLSTRISSRPDGGITMVNVTARQLISNAYPAVPGNTIGLPEWATNTRYDVAATASLRDATADDLRTMMAAMLADRFKLLAHYEPREVPAFDLVLARADRRLGSGLKPTEVDCVAELTAARAAAGAAIATGASPPRPAVAPRGEPPAPCSVRMVGNRMEGDMTMSGWRSSCVLPLDVMWSTRRACPATTASSSSTTG